MTARKILAIDDLEASLDLYEVLIRKLIPNVTYLKALDGSTGIEMAHSEKPDVVLVDAKLPGMDGFEVVQKLRASEVTSTIPILMVSGVMTTQENSISGFHSGADGYICKPFQTEEFIAEINVLLRIKSYEDRLLQNEQDLERELEKRTGDLKESQERFRTLFDQSPDAVFVESKDHIVLDANSAACELQGLPREKLIGKSVTELVPPHIGSKLKTNFPDLFEGITPIIESETLRSNGEVIPVEIRSNHITFNNEDAAILIVRDIRRRKKIETALETIATEVSPLTGFSFFYSLVEQLCRVMEVDFAAFATIKEDDPTTAVTFALCEKGKILDNIEYLIEGTPCQETRDDGVCIIRDDIQTKFPNDEHLKNLDIQSYMGIALRNSKGHLMGHLFIMDRKPLEQTQLAISMLRIFGSRASAEYERIQSAERVWESEERYRSLTDDVLDQSLVGLFILDDDNTVVWANNILSTYFQINREEFIGKPFDELFDQNIGNQFADPKLARSIILGNQPEGSTNQTHFYLPKHQDRDELWLEFTNKPINTGLYGGGAIKHFTDITRQKALQEQLLQSQKMEGIGRLAGGVAHDFNNLLTTILGFSQMVLEDLEPDSPLRDNVNEVIHAGKLAEKLTRQLLVFGRKQITQIKVVDLNEIVDDMHSIMRRTIGEDIHLKAVLSPNLKPVEVDRGQIEQVIMNLCVNARDAMPSGGNLLVETRQVSLSENSAKEIVNASPGEYTQLRITDTGSGIPKDVIPHVFEPFFTTKEQDKGTGLGLSIVYGIVTQFDGFLELNTTEGEGTEIRIFLPSSNKPLSTLPQAAPEELPNGSETILVVEDEETVRHLTVRILESLGYMVETASDGIEALEVYDKSPERFDLILSDVIMPSMGGRQLWEELLKRNPNIKIVFTSGFTEERVQHHGISPTDSTLILKPYTKSELAFTVHNALHTAPKS